MTKGKHYRKSGDKYIILKDKTVHLTLGKAELHYRSITPVNLMVSYKTRQAINDYKKKHSFKSIDEVVKHLLKDKVTTAKRLERELIIKQVEDELDKEALSLG